MFDLVADVERYPSFLPWCLALRVLNRHRDGARETITSDMVVGYRVFREKFRSSAVLDAGNLRIDTDYVDGPMRSMSNAWRFEPAADGGSVVNFDIAFELRNPLLQKAASAVFEHAFAHMADAFVARAGAVYGKDRVNV